MLPEAGLRLTLYHSLMRMLNAVLAAACLAAVAGCGGEGPRSWKSARAEFVEIREVLAPARSGGEESAGYLKRYKRKTSAGEVYWVEVYDVREVQVGLVEESGRAYQWVARDGGRGEWIDLGRMVLDDAVSRLLGTGGTVSLRSVRTRASGGGAGR